MTMQDFAYPTVTGKDQVARVVQGIMRGKMNVTGVATIDGATGATVDDPRCHSRSVVLISPTALGVNFAATAYREGEFDVAWDVAGPHTIRYVILG